MEGEVKRINHSDESHASKHIIVSTPDLKTIPTHSAAAQCVCVCDAGFRDNLTQTLQTHWVQYTVWQRV